MDRYLEWRVKGLKPERVDIGSDWESVSEDAEGKSRTGRQCWWQHEANQLGAEVGKMKHKCQTICSLVWIECTGRYFYSGPVCDLARLGILSLAWLA